MIESLAVTVLSSWPEVPADERSSGPRAIYVAQALPGELVETLAARGWKVIDIRLLTGREAVLAKLEGITSGTIPAPNTTAETRALELELRVHKLLSDKTEAPKAEERYLDDKSTVDELLSFGKPAVTNVPALVPPVVPTAKPREPGPVRRGRPPGAKDMKPRDKAGYQQVRVIALQAKAKATGTDQDPEILE